MKKKELIGKPIIHCLAERAYFGYRNNQFTINEDLSIDRNLMFDGVLILAEVDPVVFFSTHLYN